MYAENDFFIFFTVSKVSQMPVIIVNTSVFTFSGFTFYFYLVC